MATQAYWTWVNAGRHWTLARPIADMVAVAQRHGIVVLGTIGNEDHLQAATPEDHTPFSYTAEPVPANGNVCAGDFANVNNFGAAILRDARAGKLPWLKYMNFGGGNYGHEDGFQHRYDNDDEHVHLSCFSDWATRSIGNYDPFVTDGDSSMVDWETVTALQIGITDIGHQDATAPGWARGYERYNLRDVETRLNTKVDSAVSAIRAGQQAPPPITDAQMEALAQRVAAIIGGSIAAQVGNMIAARMKE
jgi:hypothetical protein